MNTISIFDQSMPNNRVLINTNRDLFKRKTQINPRTELQTKEKSSNLGVHVMIIDEAKTPNRPSLAL